MRVYDFIIAGGGAAGLGLAYQMATSSLRGRQVLIVDRDSKERNDRTWCFWADHPTRFDHLIYRRWDQVEVVSEGFRRKFDLRPYEYRMIRGIDFYQGMRESLSGVPGIHFMQARVDAIDDARDKKGAEVTINQEPYGALWAFDSIFNPAEFSAGPRRYHYLRQHFKGWEIETPTDCFDPSLVTLFDFRTPQKDCLRFFYVLPLTRRRALVEYTLFSASLLKPHEYDRAIADYIENVRGIPKYRIDAVETGAIPITDRPFPRRLGERVMAIGTRGGMVKPPTGYAFLRMQRDAAAIVHSLVNYGHPFLVPHAPARYRLYDSLMLQLMHRQGNQMKSIFLRLFQKNEIQDIFRFFDETATPGENLRLIRTLPGGPFLKALFKVKLLRKV